MGTPALKYKQKSTAGDHTCKRILDSTELAKTLPILSTCIATISASLKEESKVYLDIGDMVKNDTEVLKKCKADDRGGTLLDYLETKLGDTNIILLGTFIR